jgi:hypothetical protein
MNVPELLISNFLGFILGIIASFISWWILFRVLRPKIKFSDSIGKRKSKAGYSVYRVKMVNISRRRAIDLEIYARVKLARVGDKKNTRVVALALDVNGVTTARRMYLKPGFGKATILKVLPNKTKEFASARPLLSCRVGISWKDGKTCDKPDLQRTG